jgi:methenyltetrahydrofolate cyclohydrolase
MVAVTGPDDDLLELPLADLLEHLASETPTPGAGAVAALAAAMAAGLVRMVAGASSGWGEARGVAAQAQALRGRLGPLAATNAEAYQLALASLALSDDLAPDVRSLAISNALGHAADVPLQIAGAAADVALLAAEAAAHGELALRPDAAVAAVLAEGSARAAAHLVEVNLTITEDDERIVQARAYAATAAETARDVLRTATGEP